MSGQGKNVRLKKLPFKLEHTDTECSEDRLQVKDDPDITRKSKFSMITGKQRENAAYFDTQLILTHVKQQLIAALPSLEAAKRDKHISIDRE